MRPACASVIGDDEPVLGSAPVAEGAGDDVVGVVTATGVTAVDGSDTTDSPATFVAITVNVYAVPFVNPVIVHDVAGAFTVHEPPPGPAVTVYDVTGEPPSSAGAVHDTVAEPSPGTAVTFVAGPGTFAATNDSIAPTVVPSAFVAVVR